MKQDNIPTYLKETQKWCVWSYEKSRKIPKNPRTGKNASVNKEETFSDFKTAKNASDYYDGLGIKVSEKLIAIDLDHCIEDDTVQSWAKDILSKFRGSYIEYSPSKTGFRLFALMSDDLIYDTRRYKMKSSQVEVYVSGFTNRFVTITGDVYQDGDILENKDGVQFILDTYLKRESKITYPSSQGKSYLSKDEVIAKASTAKNKEKFLKLWKGDISGYASRSEADMALSCILAFYCGGDISLMDEVFRESSLFRDKWNSYRGSKTYGQITLEEAVSKTTEFYTPISHTDSSLDFNDKLSRLRNLGFPLSKTYAWTDIGAGLLFADFYKEELVYVPERKGWYYFEDGIWQKDVGNLKAMKKCMELANLVHLLALDIEDSDKRSTYLTFSKKWQSYNYRSHLLKDAQVHHPKSSHDFDVDPYLLNCKNGTLNLRNYSFKEHDSRDYLTKMANVNYLPSQHFSRWDEYIDEIMSHDKEKIKFLQKMLGYGLSGDTRHECMIILYGLTTRNGKGTLCETMLKVLGSYACASRPETIAQNKTSSQAPSEDIARLNGIRFVNIPEPGKGLVMNVAQVKSMTGNDTLNARFLHENSFDFKPTFKIYINTNYLPIVSDITIFKSGRIYIIPFDRHFKEMEQDKTLKQVFISEEAKSSILNWLIIGHKLLSKEGLSPPKTVIDVTKLYEHDSDKMLLFMEECLEAGDFEVKTSEVYQRYKSWCLDSGYYSENMKGFKTLLESKAEIKRKRPRSGGDKTTVLIGYRLISEFLN